MNLIQDRKAMLLLLAMNLKENTNGRPKKKDL
jgi:hypothetical protein